MTTSDELISVTQLLEENAFTMQNYANILRFGALVLIKNEGVTDMRTVTRDNLNSVYDKLDSNLSKIEDNIDTFYDGEYEEFIEFVEVTREFIYETANLNDHTIGSYFRWINISFSHISVKYQHRFIDLLDQLLESEIPDEMNNKFFMLLQFFQKIVF